jgi:hypothetical protein
MDLTYVTSHFGTDYRWCQITAVSMPPGAISVNLPIPVTYPLGYWNISLVALMIELLYSRNDLSEWIKLNPRYHKIELLRIIPQKHWPVTIAETGSKYLRRFWVRRQNHGRLCPNIKADEDLWNLENSSPRLGKG